MIFWFYCSSRELPVGRSPAKKTVHTFRRENLDASRFVCLVRDDGGRGAQTTSSLNSQPNWKELKGDENDSDDEGTSEEGV